MFLIYFIPQEPQDTPFILFSESKETRTSRDFSSAVNLNHIFIAFFSI